MGLSLTAPLLLLKAIDQRRMAIAASTNYPAPKNPLPGIRACSWLALYDVL